MKQINLVEGKVIAPEGMRVGIKYFFRFDVCIKPCAKTKHMDGAAILPNSLITM